MPAAAGAVASAAPVASAPVSTAPDSTAPDSTAPGEPALGGAPSVAKGSDSPDGAPPAKVPAKPQPEPAPTVAPTPAPRLPVAPAAEVVHAPLDPTQPGLDDLFAGRGPRVGKSDPPPAVEDDEDPFAAAGSRAAPAADVVHAPHDPTQPGLDDIFAAQGPRASKGKGKPSDDDDDDVPGGSTVEGAGNPGSDSANRIAQVPRPDASSEAPWSPLLERDARMAFGGGGGVAAPGGGAFAAAIDAALRMSLSGEEQAPEGGSVIEAAGNPVREGRMPVGDRAQPASAGPSKLESLDQASGERFPVTLDCAGAPDSPGGALPLSQDRYDRISFGPSAAAAAGPSPVGFYGDPSRDRSARFVAGTDVDEGPAAGGGLAVSSRREDRVRSGPQDSADAPVGADLALSRDRADRMGGQPPEPDGEPGGSLVLSKDRTDRVRWRPVQRGTEEGGGPLPLATDRGERMGRAAEEGDGAPGGDLAVSQDRGDRIGRAPGPGDGPAGAALAVSLDRGDRMGRAPEDSEGPVGGDLSLSKDRGDRMGRAPEDSEGPVGGDLSLSKDRGDRMGRAPGDAEGPVGGDLSLSKDRGDRMGRAPEDAEGPVGGDLSLSKDRGDRLGRPSTAEEGAGGGDVALSRDRGDRMGRQPEAAEGPVGADLVLSRDRSERMTGIDVDGPAAGELALSRDRADRMRRGPLDEDLPGPVALVLSRDRGDRMGWRPVGDPNAAPSELVLSRDRGDRVGRASEGDSLPAGGDLSLSRDRSDRLLRQPRDLDVGDLADVFAPSREREDRLGYAPAAGAVPAGSGLQLSRDRTLRMSPVPAHVDVDSAIPDLNTAAFAEAGRYDLRNRGGGTDRGPVPTGLEDLMPHRGMRGADRMRLVDDELEDDELLELDGRTPVAPRRVEILGRARPDERQDEEGYERELVREKTHRRLEFVFQRYEMLIVRRGIYKLKGVLGSSDYVTRDPVFISGKVPLGNGMLAQVVAARFGDHATLVDLSNQIGRQNFEVEAERLEQAIDGAAPLGRAVLDIMHAEVLAEKIRQVDSKGIATLRPTPKRRQRGELKAVSTKAHVLLVHTDEGDELSPLLNPPGRTKANGTFCWDLFLERIGWNRAGIWAGVRRRFTACLVTHPQQAAYALFLSYAIENARVTDRGELANRCRALHEWLLARRAEFDDAENGLQYAIIHSLTMWERMTWVDESGGLSEEPPMRPLPKTFEPTWELQSDREVEQTVLWGSLVASCRALGIRPWEYLYDLFQASAADRADDLSQWTPAAWALTTRT